MIEPSLCFFATSNSLPYNSGHYYIIAKMFTTEDRKHIKPFFNLIAVMILYLIFFLGRTYEAWNNNNVINLVSVQQQQQQQQQEQLTLDDGKSQKVANTARYDFDFSVKFVLSFFFLCLGKIRKCYLDSLVHIDTYVEVP